MEGDGLTDGAPYAPHVSLQLNFAPAVAAVAVAQPPIPVLVSQGATVASM
jgi:hypothetical protein